MVYLPTVGPGSHQATLKTPSTSSLAKPSGQTSLLTFQNKPRCMIALKFGTKQLAVGLEWNLATLCTPSFVALAWDGPGHFGLFTTLSSTRSSVGMQALPSSSCETRGPHLPSVREHRWSGFTLTTLLLPALDMLSWTLPSRTSLTTLILHRSSYTSLWSPRRTTTSCMLDSPLIPAAFDFGLSGSGHGDSSWLCMGVDKQARSLVGSFELWLVTWLTTFNFVPLGCQFCPRVIALLKFTFIRGLRFGTRWCASSWYSVDFVSWSRWTWQPLLAALQPAATPVFLALPSTALASAVTKQELPWPSENVGDSFAERNWHLLASQSPLGSLLSATVHIRWSTSSRLFMKRLRTLLPATRQGVTWRLWKFVASLTPFLTPCWFENVGNWSAEELGGDRRRFTFWKPVPLLCLCVGHHVPAATLALGSFRLATTCQRSPLARKVEHVMLNSGGFSGKLLLTPLPLRSDGEEGSANLSGTRPTLIHAEHFLLESMFEVRPFAATSRLLDMHAGTLGGPSRCEKSWSIVADDVAHVPENKLRHAMTWIHGSLQLPCILLQHDLLGLMCADQGAWMSWSSSNDGCCLPEGSFASDPLLLVDVEVEVEHLCAGPRSTQEVGGPSAHALTPPGACAEPQALSSRERQVGGLPRMAAAAHAEHLQCESQPMLISSEFGRRDLCVCPLKNCNVADFSRLSGVLGPAGTSLPDELARRGRRLCDVMSWWPGCAWHRLLWPDRFLGEGHVVVQWSWSSFQAVDVSLVLVQNLVWKLEYPLTWQQENISILLIHVFKPLYLSGFVMVEFGMCTWVPLVLVFQLPLQHRPPLLPTSSRSSVQSSAFVSSGYAERWEFFGVWKIPKVLSCLSGLPSRSWPDGLKCIGFFFTAVGTAPRGSNQRFFTLTWLPCLLWRDAVDVFILMFNCKEKSAVVASKSGLQSWPVPTLLLFAELGPAYWNRPRLPGLAKVMEYCPATGKISSAGSAIALPLKSASLRAQAGSSFPTTSSGHDGEPLGKSKKLQSSPGKNVIKNVLKKPAAKFGNDTAPGFLRRAKVKSALTRRHYVDFSEKFRSFAKENNWVIPDIGNPESLDIALESFCEAEALKGNGIFGARAAVYGEAWRRGLNLKLPETLALRRGALVGWSKAAPGDSRDPLP